MSLVFTDGQKGKRSKSKVRLSVNTVFGSVSLHVWEDGKITHTFYPDLAFLEAVRDESTKALDRQAELLAKELLAREKAAK